MSLERRSFLKFFGASATAAALRPYGWIVGDDGLYSNPALGLHFTPPPGWHFATRIDYELLVDSFRVNKGEDAKEAALALAGRPLLAITRDEITHDGEEPSPTIVVWIQPDDPSDPVTLTTSHHRAYSAYANYMDDFVFVEKPKKAKFAGMPCSRCVVEYTEEYEPAPRVKVRNKSHVLRKAGFWFTFNLVDAASGWAPATAETFKVFEESVRIDEAATRGGSS